MKKSTFKYKRIGDTELFLDAYLPDVNSNQKAILWLHPGALMMCNKEIILNEQVAFYQSLGYCVISIDYRLAPETKLPEIIQDVKDAYQWIAKEGVTLFNINSEAISIVGHSAGGYLALLMGGILYPRPEAIISFYGYGDLAWFIGSDPYYMEQPLISKRQAYLGKKDDIVTGTEFTDFEDPRWQLYVYCRQQGVWLEEVATTQSLNKLKQFIPIENIDENYPPTILFHGDKDTDVPVDQSKLMAKALKEHGIRCELIVLENMGHMFDRTPDASLDRSPSGLSHPVVKSTFDSLGYFLQTIKG